MKTLEPVVYAQDLARAAVLAVLCLSLTTSRAPADELPPGNGAKVGDRCNAGDPPPRPGLICRPGFVEVGGQLQEEWEYDSGHVVNGRKGDAILSPGCGLVANLLRKVSPAQDYSHSGIMVVDRYQVRHSTASEERIFDYGAGDPAGADGAIESVLKHGWPGTITQWSDEAFEGALLVDPQSNKSYELHPFNGNALSCGDSGDVVAPAVLKPPPEVDADPANGARARLHNAADAALGINGHYRFYGYTSPADILYTPVNTPDWANGTVGSVCSALVWRAMKDANITLEGGVLEPEDLVDDRKAQIDALTPDGLYLYTESERRNAAGFLYDEIFDMVYAQAGPVGDFLADAPDDTGNQVLNCFGFDWCGETFSFPALTAGCDPGDERAQDSPCWNNVGPGVGRAVSPDDMMSWDRAPNGPYGYKEDLSYAPGGYFQVYRWGSADGTATLKGTVSDGGSAVQAFVLVDGLGAMDISDEDGAYQIEAVPEGPWTVKTCSPATRGAANLVVMPNSGELVQDLALADGCDQAPNPGKWRRRVRIHGTVKVVDFEDLSSNEIDVFGFDESYDLEPNTPGNPAAQLSPGAWLRCTGDEVRTRLKFELDLDQHDRSVDIGLVTKMFEGTSCPNDDLDSTFNKSLTVAEDGSASINFTMENEEWGGKDTITVNLTVENSVAPQN